MTLETKPPLPMVGGRPHARSQFRINLNDIAAIYGEVREVDIRDPESY